MNETIEIPNKSSFKINEVCSLTGVKSYVLRFWESEFPEISPMISSSGVKLYEHKDIEIILMIKKLLFEDRMSIEKAKGEIKALGPNVNLVEDQYTEALSFENLGFSHDHLKSQRVLLDSEFQKLVAAKVLLSKIVEKLDVINQRHEWN
jgi:DNA-binding transcriptional MerR regulator